MQRLFWSFTTDVEIEMCAPDKHWNGRFILSNIVLIFSDCLRAQVVVKVTRVGLPASQFSVKFGKLYCRKKEKVSVLSYTLVKSITLFLVVSMVIIKLYLLISVNLFYYLLLFIIDCKYYNAYLIVYI